jgi:hypothetical protein
MRDIMKRYPQNDKLVEQQIISGCVEISWHDDAENSFQPQI